MTKQTPKPLERVCVVCRDVFTPERVPGRPPITCSEECQKKRRNDKIAEWRVGAICPPKAHGTITGYNTYQCPCSLCRRAERLYIQERRNTKEQNDDIPGSIESVGAAEAH